MKNLLDLGAYVASIDFGENPAADINFNTNEDPYVKIKQLGIKLALIAVNDTYHTSLVNEILDLELFERILLEKPGSLNS